MLNGNDITTNLSINNKMYGLAIEGRSDNRYELKLPLEKDFINSSLIHNKLISMIINGILQSLRIEIDTLSIIRSKNNQLEQHWHTDTTPIFQSFQKKNKLCTPPESIVMISPLINIDKNLGPTEFLPGTHKWDNDRNYNLNLFNEMLLLDLPNVNTHCSPELNIGDVILFDIRLYHRGGKNKTNISRDLLYISYCPEWYQDRINFQFKNTKIFDDINDKDKLLLSRVDAVNYINDLENLLIKNNINISEIHSKNYQRRKLKHILE